MKTHQPVGLRSLIAPLALVAGFGLLTGCGGSKKDEEKGNVSGKVTLGDKPVGGTVVFKYADGKELQGNIATDGSYTIVDPAPGAVTIFIKPPAGTGMTAIKGGAELPKNDLSGAGVPPPAKYQSPGTSGLTYDVKAGKQTYDIPLK